MYKQLSFEEACKLKTIVYTDSFPMSESSVGFLFSKPSDTKQLFWYTLSIRLTDIFCEYCITEFCI